MRQAGILDNERDAKRLSDYLLTQGIESRVTSEDGKWGLWIYDENKLDRGKDELAQFVNNPADPRYAAAAQSAAAVRKKAEQAAKQARKNTIELRGTWNSPSLRRQKATIGLLFVCILVGVLTGLGKRTPLATYLLIDSHIDDQEGQHPAARELVDVQNGQVWRLITPIFLHFGPLHLLFNLLWMYDLGSAIESRQGTRKLLWLVLAIAVPSNMAQFYASGPLFGGISGVVAGLFGYIWMKMRFDPESGYFLNPMTVLFMLAYLLLIGPMFGAVANWCHGVGLLTGMLMGASPRRGR